MAPRYLLRVVTDFAAAHSLRGYAGECSRLHGHNWKLEVEVLATALDDLGMGIDFKAIKTAARNAIANFDHQYLNERPPFHEINPTAENIAAPGTRGEAGEVLFSIIKDIKGIEETILKNRFLPRTVSEIRKLLAWGWQREVGWNWKNSRLATSAPAR